MMVQVIALLAGLMPAQDSGSVRSQQVGERSYIQIRVKMPTDLRLPRSQRGAIAQIAPYDVGRYPRLVPIDAGVDRVAWHFSTGSMLEFLGVAVPGSGQRFRLIYPTEEDWQEFELSVDLSSAVAVPAATRRSARAPAENDLEGRWAAAWSREFALREHLSGAALFADVRRVLCRTYRIADMWPRSTPPIAEPDAARTIPVDELLAVEPADHPWHSLLAGRSPPIETLARTTPAEFYYLRLRTPVASHRALDRLLRAAGWAAALDDQADGVHQLRDRYLRQLAFPLDGQGQPDFPRRVREMAIVGSDLHVRLGTDLTVMMLGASGLEAELEAGLDRARREWGEAVREDSFEYQSVAVLGHITADGALRSYRAMVGGLTICSNSPAAMRRVIDVVKRRAPALADTLDFRLTRCRFAPDAVTEDVLLYFSEAFQLAQLSPRRRIGLARRAAETRREQAARHAEMFAAWDRGEPMRPAIFSLPLIDRPIDRVSRAEDEAYIEFRQRSRTEFEPYLAPVAFRLQESRGAARVEAFLMATRRADFWDELRRKLGKGTVPREAQEFPNTALRVLASITTSETDWLRFKKRLIGLGLDKKVLDKHIPWHGSRTTLHLDNGPALAQFAELRLRADLTAADLAVPRGDRERYWHLTQMPATISIQIARQLVFMASMTQLKQLLLNAFGKAFSWEVLKEEFRRVKLVRIQPNATLLFLAFGKWLKPDEAPGVFYAHGNGAFVLAANLQALKSGVSREIAGRIRTIDRERAAAWLTIHFGALADLQTYLRTYANRQAHRHALGAAAVWQWLYELDVASDARRFLGLVPASPDGAAFRWEAQRREVVNDRHGTIRQPTLPAEPSADLPGLRALADFGRLRGEAHVVPDGLLGVVVIERP